MNGKDSSHYRASSIWDINVVFCARLDMAAYQQLVFIPLLLQPSSLPLENVRFISFGAK